uniref:Uncharacterized protein n=1 Tax=Pithovirus LCDPAC02 TaxID=2506601 RepID=A0A481YQL8_9VIRU|nr:MAG: hypothetical protein LCDPAC02_02440 [Pithovirus LCDPAC02]
MTELIILINITIIIIALSLLLNNKNEKHDILSIVIDDKEIENLSSLIKSETLKLETLKSEPLIKETPVIKIEKNNIKSVIKIDKNIYNKINLNISPDIKWKSEEKVGIIFEYIFDTKFEKNIRPEILKNPYTNRKLELDRYVVITFKNKKYTIAIEINGIHHKEKSNYFHIKSLDFEKQVMRDKWKYDKCRREGIILFIIDLEIIKYEKSKKSKNKVLIDECRNQIIKRIKNGDIPRDIVKRF